MVMNSKDTYSISRPRIEIVRPKPTTVAPPSVAAVCSAEAYISIKARMYTKLSKKRLLVEEIFLLMDCIPESTVEGLGECQREWTELFGDYSAEHEGYVICFGSFDCCD